MIYSEIDRVDVPLNDTDVACEWGETALSFACHSLLKHHLKLVNFDL
jgi:hypothetical protein